MEFLSAFQFLIPSVIAITFGTMIINIFPSTSTWARGIVVSTFFFLTIRYLVWRSLHTLNLTNHLTTSVSIIILLLEIFSWFVLIIGLVLSITRKYHPAEADRSEKIVTGGYFNPTVDILIPTYNESVDILRRTIIGCQALDYDHKKIYVLDDGNRLEIKKLAQQLGCKYITRRECTQAKAGNLNNALPSTDGDLIAVFDADFIPCRNFLARTVGFFQQPKLALLQTHQDFYNQDPIAKNWGLGGILGHPTEELSALQSQPMRSYYHSGMCYGSSFVVRRSMLEEIGGFYPKSITEDLFTAIILLAKKYDTLYLAERLSAGLAPENVPALFSQRMRWAKGTIQGIFLDANPFSIKGLNRIQRIIYCHGIINWFTSISFFLILIIFPFCYIVGIPPFVANFADVLVYFLPLFAFQLTTFFWLGDRTASKIIADIYSLILSFPLSLVIIQTLISPFAGGFSVTPKGITTKKTIFHWRLALPVIYTWLIALFSTLVCTAFLFNIDEQIKFITFVTNNSGSIKIGLFWNIYNLFIISLAILALIEKAQTDPYPWLKINTEINLLINNYQLTGISTELSETGIKLVIDDNSYIPLIKHHMPVEIEIEELGLKLKGIVKNKNVSNKKNSLKIAYQTLSLQQYRQLVEFIFCKPNRWQTKKVPGEFKSFLLLIKVLIRKTFSLPWQFQRKKLTVTTDTLTIENELTIKN